MQPRGIRNNNPGNIEYSARNKWVGQIGPEPKGRFALFDSPENGIRALAKIVIAYYERHKLRTVRTLISRYAPPTENETNAYVNYIARVTGLAPDTPFVLSDSVLRLIVWGIIKHENAGYEYPAAVFNEGIKRAH